MVVGEPVQKSSIRWSVPYNVKDVAGSRAHTVWRDVVVEEVDLANVEAEIQKAIDQALTVDRRKRGTSTSSRKLLLFGMIGFVFFSLVMTNKNFLVHTKTPTKGVRSITFRTALWETVVHLSMRLLSPMDCSHREISLGSLVRRQHLLVTFDEIHYRSLITPSSTGDGVRSRRAHCGSNWRLG